jgi:membrane dipeptidase
VAVGTDLDGNYQPVLTSYAQFEDLAGLLRDRGPPEDRIRQTLGGNIAALLRRIIP